jgi:hypothetical protein
MLKETKHERFKRIAGKRTNDILDKIRLLGNCANRNTYEYSKDEVNKIIKEIEKNLKIAKLKFLPGGKQRFEL